MVADVESESEGSAPHQPVQRRRPCDAQDRQSGPLPEPGGRAAVLCHDNDAVALIQRFKWRQPLLELIAVAGWLREEGDDSLM
jgi:hypothetical protein